MDTTALKAFAQKARTDLMHQVGAQLKVVLALDSLARREQPQAILRLESEIEKKGTDVVIDEVAYTWFNRFCALRFMDVNHYNKVGVISPGINQIQPEILSNAKSGVFDTSVVNERKRERVLDLLAGRVQSRDAQGEAYRILLVSYCNALAKSMDFLFEKIADYTELLLPSDLLAVNSVLADCRTAMTEEDCEDVEVIGWLYQFYISERKDEVFAGFKKGKKAGSRDIPAATQLFTPHWIVQYLLDNSLGRLWMLNNPRSRLIEKMEYYIKPEQEETDYLRISKPEEIKVCDPACGSGHMLTYAFDLLYEIYEEQGYDPTQIPILILQNNLYGIEIDQRAGDLASFALVMKARKKSRNFFVNHVRPNVMVLEKIDIDEGYFKEYTKHINIDAFATDIKTNLQQFKDANLAGSLIIPKITAPDNYIEKLKEVQINNELFQANIHDNIIKLFEQIAYLSQRYHVVVTNPPYIKVSVISENMREFVQNYYSNSKINLDTCFINRALKLLKVNGIAGMITQSSFLFKAQYKQFRKFFLKNSEILQIVKLGSGAFPEVKGEVLQTAMFIFTNSKNSNYCFKYLDLTQIEGHSNKEITFRNSSTFELVRLNMKQLGQDMLFVDEQLGNKNYSNPKIGCQPGAELVYLWWETNQKNEEFVAYNKGGPYRKWYGNSIWYLKYGRQGEHVLRNKGTLSNKDYYFKDHISWTRVSSNLNMRFYDNRHLFDNTSPGIFNNLFYFLGYYNSKIASTKWKDLFYGNKIESGQINYLSPVLNVKKLDKIENNTSELIDLAKKDWDSYEFSWDFSSHPLLAGIDPCNTLSVAYDLLRSNWVEMIRETKRLEEENNSIFIESYNVEDELIPVVPLEEITLTCNPRYRYRGNKSDEELEALLLADTMKEFISYAVGCMFGRYSLDKPGLVLANQGDTYEDYKNLVPDSSFPADKNNAIPILDGDWFADDIVSRFRRFLRVTFGSSHFEANLKFIEQALGKDIRQYFLKDFYNDHVQRYKKRPIYWMFSSPDGNFNVLIYMHRYNPDTVSIVRNEYLREYMSKLTGHIVNLQAQETNMSLTKGERTRALKEIDKINKIYDGLEKYEQDVIFPLATQRLEIDLDDGVRVNYPKFGAALKKIAGLEAKDEE